MPLLEDRDIYGTARLDARDPITVGWVHRHDRDRAALDAWSVTVGPPVLSDAGSARFAERVDSLTAVTWNVHVGGGDLISFVEDLRAGQLTGRAEEHFVLLLQEVHRSGAEVPRLAGRGRAARRIAADPLGGERLDIVAAARRLRLNLFYAPSMRNGRSDASLPEDCGDASVGGDHGTASEPPEDRGNAILSTLPLLAPTAVELPFEGQRRISVGARMEGTTSDGSSWELDVVSVHFDNRSRWSRVLASLGAGRLRQARGLVDALCPETPTVLGGDLNTWATRRLESVVPFLNDRFPQTPSCPGEPTFTLGHLVARRLDHLFFRLPDGQHARVARARSRYGSDHYPVIGRIRLGGLAGRDQRATS